MKQNAFFFYVYQKSKIKSRNYHVGFVCRRSELKYCIEKQSCVGVCLEAKRINSSVRVSGSRQLLAVLNLSIIHSDVREETTANDNLIINVNELCYYYLHLELWSHDTYSSLVLLQAI